MTPSQPKVSVLIPTYNYARYLPEAIESVLAQDFTDFELLIGDDASKDNSAEIIRRYATLDPRIRFQIHQPNLGMVANWNWCLQQARGEYIKYIFGDDCFASRTALSKMVGMLDSHPAASLAVSARFTIDEKSAVTGIWDEFGATGHRPGADTILHCLKAGANLIGEPSVVLFRRAQAARGFSPTLRQIVDLEMWFYLLLQGEMAYTPEPLYCFRLHGAQQTVANRESQAGDLEMVGILRDYFSDTNQTLPLNAGPFTRRQIFFRTAIQLAKKKIRRPGLSTELDWVRSQVPFAWRMPCWFLYRLGRPWENLRRSARKRYLRRKAAREFSEQAAFLKSLPGSNATP